MNTIDAVRQKWNQMKGNLNERARRQWAAAEAMALGYGGRRIVGLATGLASSTIGHGINELRATSGEASEGLLMLTSRSRRPGGGRKSVTETQPGILEALEALIGVDSRGDPESPLRWTAKSRQALSGALPSVGFEASPTTVGKLLHKLGYSLQGNAKELEGSHHPDRNAQFEYIQEQVASAQRAGNPTISVDTKKKELVGQYKNRGRELRPKGEPERVDVHDFMGELGRASPYGVYDMLRKLAWVSVGVSADTSEFAVESIRKWWHQLGKQHYDDATALLITADCGGSNGSRVRLWKVELQKLADELGKEIIVCHLPPGTSKWNRIEHSLFSHISMNWRGKPLTDYLTIVRLIGATTTKSGLVVRCAVDERTYEKGRKVSDAEMARVNLHRHEFHGEWNYSIKPSPAIAVGST